MATSLKSSSPLTWIVSPFRPTEATGERDYRFAGSSRSWLIPLALGAALLVVGLVGWALDAYQFFFSYLVGWSFCLAISLGALFFVLIHHITKARWSVVVRRLAEVLAFSFPLLALLSIPILFGIHDLYHWSHSELLDPNNDGFDAIIAGKQAYLNVPFFLARVAVYLLVWSYLSWRLYQLSLRQDVDPDPAIPAKMRKTSAWGIPVFAITTAFASYDFLMSLDPHWFSTIFGVYFFAGAFSSAIATITMLALSLQRFGVGLQRTVTIEHYHDLGKWMFAFTVFWAYIAFSQYMLIWYAGLPEETIWFRHRLEHGWGYHSAALLFLHFIVPFIILLPRSTKRIPLSLGVMTVWFLIMQFVDLHWLALPVLHEHGGFHWMDFACWLGLFGIYLAAALFRLSRHSLVPHNDPYLPASLRFENA